jgi:Fe-S cluster biogenesis protein NfuA/nitrite reductase/ring-hydroxylating ferredoxin subunit
MATGMQQAREQAAHLDALLERVEALPEPARATAAEAVQALVDLYGDALGRMVERTRAVAGADAAAALADDELLEHLLLLHGLHPVPVEERVAGALDEVRPYLSSHGGGVELLGIDEGVVRLRLQGSCSGCPSSAMTLKLAVERAIAKTAPDIERVEAQEGDADGGGGGGENGGLLQIESLLQPAGAGEDWTPAGAMPQLSGGGTLIRRVAGQELLFLSVDDTLYAYRPLCAACSAALGDAELDGPELECRGCGRRYDVRRAGRCVDVPSLHLEPVPLLVGESGIVRVAVGA